MRNFNQGMFMQLDLIEEMTEYKLLSSQIKEIIETQNKVRRNVFAQLNEHDKVLLKLQDQIDYLRMNQIVQVK